MLSVLLGTLLFVNKQMERLTRPETGDTVVWDSLQVLLRQKDHNTRRMLNWMSRTADSLLTDVDIARIVEKQDTVVIRQQVRRQVVTRHDTLRTPVPKKKGFFKRLGEAFVPPKADTTIHVRVTTEIATDTVTYEGINPVDSLKAMLQDAARGRTEQAERDERRKQYWGRMDRELSARMDSLLKGQERQILARAKEQQQKDQEERLHAARTVGGIAAGGITLAAVFLLVIGRDVARNNRYRKQTEEARARAEQLLATRERMMLAITHDFKAPLGTIKGYADLLERLTDDARQRFYLESMNKAADHLLKLVTDLLEFHRLERGAVEIKRVTFCPAGLVEEVADAFRPMADEKKLQIRTVVDKVLEGRFVGAPMRIRQILMNLTGNAIKFTEQGEVTLKANYDRIRRTIRLEVVDTGLGMTVEERNRIWGEFTRLPSAQGKEGCGLGLSIVRLLVELLEGEIEVDSQPGKGSIFTVILPLYPLAEWDNEKRAESEETQSVEDNKLIRPDEKQVNALKLLLIDDDALQLRLTN